MSVNIEPTGRRPDQVEVEVTGSTEDAAERQSAEAELNELISRFAPAHLQLVGGIRQWLRRRLPAAHELAYEYRARFVISYSPSERGYEGIVAIRGDANGVKLYFNQGKDLPDPEKLLKGTSQTRFIDVVDASTLDSQAVARLLDEAIARSGVPFESTDRGCLVIRSASARKRTRPRS